MFRIAIICLLEWYEFTAVVWEVELVYAFVVFVFV